MCEGTITMRIQYDKEFYSKEALLKAAYHFTDRAYVYLGVEDGSFFVDFTAKGGIQFDKEKLENEFKNELLAQVIHQTVSKETTVLRELLVARALSSTMVDEGISSDVAESPMTEDAQDALDAIAKDWFDEK